MAHKVLSRTKEAASTTGTGTFTLAGAAAGFLSFASGLTVDGDTTWYMAVNGAEWEEGLGTRVSAATMSRTPIRSSNANALVNFSVAPTVFGTVPGTKMDFAGPAFKAYRNTSQSITNNTQTKIQMNAELFDTDNCFDSTTNFRFTPNVAGYYQLNWGIWFGGTVTTAVAYTAVNGTSSAEGAQAAASTTTRSSGSDLVLLNGSTDYAEIHCYVTGSALTVDGSANFRSTFSGSFVRPA